MPVISSKGKKMPESPIRKLVPFSETAKAKGIKVYHLNIGQPDIETPETALAAIKNYDLNVIAYTHSAGNISYRKKLVEYYKQHDIHITPEDIIVTTGASEALLFTLQSILNAGDEIIIPEPFYANYLGFSIQSDVNVVPIPSDINSGFALPPIEEFEKKITDHTKAIMVCNPNNPTGYLYSKKELESLRVLAQKYDLFLIADEVYREFVYDGHEHFSIMNLDGLDNNTILIDSVSKRYSACGFRLGMMISKNKELIATALKFAQARLSPPSFGQIGGEAALQTPASYFEKVLDEYTQRRNIIVNSINQMEGAFCPNPAGAFYIVAKLPIDNSDRFCRWLLEDFSFEDKTVMFAPASGFYSTPGQGNDEVRISYVLNVDDLADSMRILNEALQVYPGRT
jgi:aspartate aminotransferase